jgi:hypothetical protein
MNKYYRISKHNSTVCGYPGRNFDWAKFDWEQGTSHDFGDMKYSIESEYITDNLKGKRIGIKKAPPVFKDNYFIAKGCEYLHVPYNWAESGTIYRVRPNESMYAGKVYRSKLIKSQRATKRRGKWFWVLEVMELKI